MVYDRDMNSSVRELLIAEDIFIDLGLYGVSGSNLPIFKNNITP